MGVYIENMEMPKHCEDCEWLQQRFPGGKDWCKRTGELVHESWESATTNPIPESCPLVPVPQHGKLGDLDSLALLVLNWISTQEKAYPHEDSNALAWRLGAKAMANQIYRDIKAYPTIIPADKEE